MNGLSIAPIANLIHRVPPFQSRHIHDLSLVCSTARTNQYMYSFFSHTISLWNNLPDSVVHSNSVADLGGVRGVQMHPPLAASNVFLLT